jgi:hypothetical protein
MSSKRPRSSRGLPDAKLPDAKRRRKVPIDLTNDAVPIEVAVDEAARLNAIVAAAADAAAAAAAAAAFAKRTTDFVRALLAMTADLDGVDIIMAHVTGNGDGKGERNGDGKGERNGDGKGERRCTDADVENYQRTRPGKSVFPCVGDKLKMRLPTCARQEPPQETAHDRLRRKLKKR